MVRNLQFHVISIHTLDFSSFVSCTTSLKCRLLFGLTRMCFVLKIRCFVFLSIFFFLWSVNNLSYSGILTRWLLLIVYSVIISWYHQKGDYILNISIQRIDVLSDETVLFRYRTETESTTLRDFITLFFYQLLSYINVQRFTYQSQQKREKSSENKRAKWYKHHVYCISNN